MTNGKGDKWRDTNYKKYWDSYYWSYLEDLKKKDEGKDLKEKEIKHDISANNKRIPRRK